jgi:hypothetical protein
VRCVKGPGAVERSMDGREAGCICAISRASECLIRKESAGCDEDKEPDENRTARPESQSRSVAHAAITRASGCPSNTGLSCEAP